MKLGPIQEAWLTSLEQNPERRMVGALGKKQPDGTYAACCLGEGGLIAGVCEWMGNTLIAKRESNKSKSDHHDGLLGSGTYKALGLRSEVGVFKDSFKLFQENADPILSLAQMNDAGYTWPQIAAFIRANPEKVFTHPV